LGRSRKGDEKLNVFLLLHFVNLTWPNDGRWFQNDFRGLRSESSPDDEILKAALAGWPASPALPLVVEPVARIQGPRRRRHPPWVPTNDASKATIKSWLGILPLLVPDVRSPERIFETIRLTAIEK
jgi:hypothetical protein